MCSSVLCELSLRFVQACCGVLSLARLDLDLEFIMACSDMVIRIADDIDLESLPDGNPQIHYASPSTYGMTQGAHALQVFLDILSIGSGTSVHLVFDWSQDGRTWRSAEFPLDGKLASTGYKSAAGFYPFFYIGQPFVELAAAYVRYGIIVYGTVATPIMGRVRLTCSVVALKNPDFLAHTWDLANTTGMEDSQSATEIGDILTTEGLSTLVVNGKLSGAPGASITFDIQTSTRYDVTDAMWKTVGTLAVSDGSVFTIEASQVLTYTRIVYSSTTASGVTLQMDVLGRS